MSHIIQLQRGRESSQCPPCPLTLPGTCPQLLPPVLGSAFQLVHYLDRQPVGYVIFLSSLKFLIWNFPSPPSPGNVMQWTYFFSFFFFLKLWVKNKPFKIIWIFEEENTCCFFKMYFPPLLLIEDQLRSGVGTITSPFIPAFILYWLFSLWQKHLLWNRKEIKVLAAHKFQN